MNYAFHCQKCGEHFDVSESLAEHEQHQEKCPKCGGTDIRSEIRPSNVQDQQKVLSAAKPQNTARF